MRERAGQPERVPPIQRQAVVDIRGQDAVRRKLEADDEGEDAGDVVVHHAGGDAEAIIVVRGRGRWDRRRKRARAFGGREEGGEDEVLVEVGHCAERRDKLITR